MEYLAVFFNSRFFRFCFKERFPELLGDTRELRKVFFDEIPVKPLNEIEWFKTILLQIEEEKIKNRSIKELENQVEVKLFDLYNLTIEERDIIKSSPNLINN